MGASCGTSDEQLERYREHYIRNSELLRTARDLVKSEKAVLLSKVLSEVAATPNEAKYHLKRVAKYIPVKIRVETIDGRTDVHVSVPEFKRDSFIDWLGYVVPKSQSGFGYESFLVDFDSDWVEALKAAITKSLERVNIKTVIGVFYEKLVARIFEVLCTSEGLRKNPELSKFTILFVFRDAKVTNVWIVTEQGRKIEFDVLSIPSMLWHLEEKRSMWFEFDWFFENFYRFELNSEWKSFVSHTLRCFENS